MRRSRLCYGPTGCGFRRFLSTAFVHVVFTATGSPDRSATGSNFLDVFSVARTEEERSDTCDTDARAEFSSEFAPLRSHAITYSRYIFHVGRPSLGWFQRRLPSRVQIHPRVRFPFDRFSRSVSPIHCFFRSLLAAARPFLAALCTTFDGSFRHHVPSRFVQTHPRVIAVPCVTRRFSLLSHAAF